MATYNFYAYYSASQQGKYGLNSGDNPVVVDIWNTSGTLIAEDASTIEINDGVYMYTLTTATEDDYIAVFKTLDSTVDQKWVPALVSKQLPRIDVTLSTIPALVWAAATRTLTGLGTLASDVWAWAVTVVSGTINIVSPIATSGDLDIISGDDYKAADGRAITWSSSDWPDLTGATITFNTGGLSYAMTATVVGSGVSQTVQLELTTTQSQELYGEFDFKVKAVLAMSAHIVTLVSAQGTCE